MKKILITGAGGFLGRRLMLELFKAGHEVTGVVRRPLSEADELPCSYVTWDMAREECPVALDAFDLVIHLAGASIAEGRWTEARKKLLLESRVLSTQSLHRALAKRSQPLPLFFGASAIGIYPYGESPVDEQSAEGTHFLAGLCKDWEAALKQIPAQRSLIMRLGVVLGDGGGALSPMLNAARWGFAGPLGSGRQRISWIHVDDIVSLVLTALDQTRYAGVINCVSPEPCTQADFARELAKLLSRPYGLPTPAGLLRLMLGEMADIVLQSQNVRAKRLEEELGFPYRFRSLRSALEDLCNIHRRDDGKAFACRRLMAQQFVPRPLEEVFPFFCDPYNLEKITPELLSFKIKDVSSPQIVEGTLINYALKVHGFPMRWRTRIEEWRTNQRFVDNQLKGPYTVWHHTHEFFAVPGGTLMTDRVRYRVPFGFLGEIFALPLVRRDVRQIFAFRRKIIGEMFPSRTSK